MIQLLYCLLDERIPQNSTKFTEIVWIVEEETRKTHRRCDKSQGILKQNIEIEKHLKIEVLPCS